MNYAKFYFKRDQQNPFVLIINTSEFFIIEKIKPIFYVLINHFVSHIFDQYSKILQMC